MLSRANFDVLVVGGGTAGCHTAMGIAKYSRQSLRILLVDRNPRSEFGKKTTSGWCCGDAVSKSYIELIHEKLGVEYGRPELGHYVEGICLYSPDHETNLLFGGDGYVLNRKNWSQKQLEAAEKLGVELKFQIAVQKLTVADNFIVGVEGVDLTDNSTYSSTAKVIVDASGSASVLRINLPINSHIQRNIDLDDIMVAGRYILEFDQGEKDETYFDPRYCLMHFDQHLAPGGYAWTFPKGANKANVGLGVQKKRLDIYNARLKKKDTLKSLIDGYVRRNPVLKNIRLDNGDEGRGNAYNTWQVPMRRQNDCLVANGYALVGDAAWMPRAIDGGGIGSALTASVILGRVVTEAIESGDWSEVGLWPYNSEYMTGYGSHMASFEVLRRLLQNTANEELNYGMKHYFTNEDIKKINLVEHPSFSKMGSLDPIMFFRALSHWSLADGLRYCAQKHRRYLKLYREYPDSPDGFTEWHKEMALELNEAYSKFP
jgi:digeranylgeranylglycerophospholipid reductase